MTKKGCPTPTLIFARHEQPISDLPIPSSLEFFVFLRASLVMWAYCRARAPDAANRGSKTEEKEVDDKALILKPLYISHYW